MSAFKATSARVDELEKLLLPECARQAGSVPPLEWKATTDAIWDELKGLEPGIAKFEKNAKETDPSKKLYGAGMVIKVLALVEKHAGLVEAAAEVKARVDPLAAAEEARLTAIEAQAAAAAKAAADAQAAKEAAVAREEEDTRARAAAEAEAKVAAEARAKAEARDRDVRAKAEERSAKARAEAEAAAAAAKKKAEADAAAAKKEADAAAAKKEADAAAAKKAAADQEAREAAARAAQQAAAAAAAAPPAGTSMEELARKLAADLAAAAATAAPRAAPAPAAAAPAPAASGAPGAVIHLQNGSAELRAIISSQGASGLTVVDYSAPWCGPCRRIEPVYAQLAARYPAAKFVHVNCEGGEANAALSREAQIRGFPTFQFFTGMTRAEEFSGANPAKIEATVQRYLPAGGAAAPAPPPAAAPAAPAAPAPPAAAAAAGGASGGQGQTMTARVGAALQQLKAGTSFEDFLAATRTLLTFVGNVLAHPADPKYRKIRLANNMFNTRLGSKPGGLQAMEAFGFVRRSGEGGEEVLVMDQVAPELGQVKTSLEQAVAAAQAAAPRAPFAPAPAPGPTLPPVGGALGQLMQQFHRNPQAMNQMMNQLAPQMGNLTNHLLQDPAAMQNLAAMLGQGMAGAGGVGGSFGTPNFAPPAPAPAAGAGAGAAGGGGEGGEDEDEEMQEALRRSMEQ